MAHSHRTTPSGLSAWTAAAACLRGGPCCRWGNAQSPAYGTLSDYQFMRPHSREKRQDKQRTAWGTSLESVQDVIDVFVRYCKGAAQTAHVECMECMCIV